MPKNTLREEEEKDVTDGYRQRKRRRGQEEIATVRP